MKFKLTKMKLFPKQWDKIGFDDKNWHKGCYKIF